jgi:hypothetical protein
MAREFLVSLIVRGEVIPGKKPMKIDPLQLSIRTALVNRESCKCHGPIRRRQPGIAMNRRWYLDTSNNIGRPARRQLND